MEYRAIGFDWGGVLNGKPGKFFGEKVAQVLGVTHEQYKEAYFHHNKKANRGEITWDELWVLVLKELGQYNPDKLEQVIKLNRESEAEDPNLKVLGLVDELKDKGYKVGLLSNNSLERAQKMRAEGLDKHFDVLHVSAETGLVKPELAAFAHFAQALGVQPAELVFIDDTDKSLSTAQECGFTPILFESYEQVSAELHKLELL